MENNDIGEGIVLGYSKLKRPGDLPEVDCRLCGQETREIYLAAITDAEGGIDWYGPLCGDCATSE